MRSLKNNLSLSGKVIVALLAACITLLLSWSIMNFSFQKVKEPVKRLSEPNPQLKLVNRLFKDVVQLDQLQRMQASREPVKNFTSFLKQSQSIKMALDTLSLFSKGNAEQLKRIDTMKSILERRDDIFMRYLSLRKDFIDNDSLNNKIRLLSDFVNNTAIRTDTNLFTTESKITATTIEEVDSNRNAVKQGFWDRLFKRKKTPERKEIRHMILEQLKTSIDTLALLHEDSVINQLSQSIAAVELDREQSRNVLIRQRMQLDRAGSSLISKLLITLNEIEQNELKKAEENNLLATDIINKGLQKIALILIVFVLLSVLLALMIFSDIARSNRYKKQLIVAKEEAEESGRAKQRFLANMSHELRTPLQAIIGFAEQMKSDRQEWKEKNIDIIYRSSNHLLHVVNEVLDYSLISSGKLVIETKPFSMKEVTGGVQETIALQAKQKGLEFQYHIEEGESDLYTGDAFRLRQILFNLLNNAIKFTPGGTVIFSVSRTEFEESTGFVFTIADTGMGIAAEDKERVFGHFEQLETAQLQQGSGLGLSIVKTLVEQQGGAITLESAIGAGSVFRVHIAYLKCPHPMPQTNPQTITTPEFGGFVWVIDDDATILSLCSLILHKHYIRHQCFHDAASLLDEPVPEGSLTILMDIRMPRMNGFDLMHILRLRLKHRDNIRYIALTAQSLPNEQDQIFAEGFDALLSKPFLAADLIRLIHEGRGQVMPFAESSPECELKEIWDSFFEETASDLAVIRRAMEEKDGFAIADGLHRVAGRCGQMGLKELARETRLEEIRLRGGIFKEDKLLQLYQSLYNFVEKRQPVAGFVV